jgi:hypothetical protein
VRLNYNILISCELLIVTNFFSRPEDIAVRKAIILSARVHPGYENSNDFIEKAMHRI